MQKVLVIKFSRKFWKVERKIMMIVTNCGHDDLCGCDSGLRFEKKWNLECHKLCFIFIFSNSLQIKKKNLKINSTLFSIMVYVFLAFCSKYN